MHCEVQQQPSGILLTDHGSTYGTFLGNGRKLGANESVTLNSGDSFNLADNSNTFRVL
jgi:pSer/pThr/pTyr-binding forkhead associated (FHA) protein